MGVQNNALEFVFLVFFCVDREYQRFVYLLPLFWPALEKRKRSTSYFIFHTKIE